jgi:hypothetical protein
MASRRKSDLRRFYEPVAKRAKYRCEYCHAPESFFPHRLCLDHIIPESSDGPTATANLALCCYGCQQQKLAFETGIDPASKKQSRIFHPRRQRWTRHFRWSNDNLRIVGLSRVGRATIERLAMNNDRQIEARKRLKNHPDLFP